MDQTRYLQMVRTNQFERVYRRWKEKKVTQVEAARQLEMSERTLRRYVVRYESEGVLGLADKRLNKRSPRRASQQEVEAVVALYTERYSRRNIRHFYNTPQAGGKVDKGNPTQFGRAMRELGVVMIPGYSPEARGRSERMFKTLQGRLPAELEERGIEEMEEANRYLAESFVDGFNERFTVEAAEEGSGFVPLLGVGLEDILCLKHSRVVGNDNCVRYKGLSLQIPPRGRGFIL